MAHHAPLQLDQYEAMLRACRFEGHINITGGEPLLHPDLFWLLEEARRRQMTTAVLTNGTLVGLQEARHMRASGVPRCDPRQGQL